MILCSDMQFIFLLNQGLNLCYPLSFQNILLIRAIPSKEAFPVPGTLELPGTFVENFPYFTSTILRVTENAAVFMRMK